MSFLDTTISPEAGYTYVNFRQVYDSIAAQLTSHAQWDFVEAVDYVSAPNTFRTYVWKNNAATSGLPADYYVGFRLQFVTTGTVYQTAPTIGLQVVIFENYNTSTKVASKLATVQSSTSFTLASDMTHPVTWTLTATIPVTAGGVVYFAFIGPTANVTSHRLFIGVTNDVIYLAQGTGPYQVYIGAFDSVMNSTDDPMPIFVSCNNTANSSSVSASGYAASTRHPMQVAGANTYLFGLTFWYGHIGTTSGANLGAGQLAKAATDTLVGVLGDAATLGWSKFLGGPIASKCCVSTVGTAAGVSGSTKGGLRGYLKYMLTAQLVAHSVGDTFDVEGKAYLALGSTAYGLWDTTA